ncbi:hypothetical protein [Streptosporangium fragile]
MSDLEVAILVGLQASGKTTFHRRVLAATHRRHRQARGPHLAALSDAM